MKRCREHLGPLCDTLPRQLWPKKGETTPVSTNAQGKVGLTDIQARTGIYTVPEQADSATG